MAFFARAPLLCAAFFAIAPLLCTVAQNDIHTTLYISQVWAPAPNEVLVIPGEESNGWFGSTYVIDWRMREGPDPSAKAIGHAQGFTMKTKGIDGGSWYTSISLAFSDGTFSGSTLQTIGFINFAKGLDSQGEWSIVGGLGQFTSARGFATYKVERNDLNSRVLKVDVHAYFSSMDSTAVYGKKSGCNSTISEPVAVN